MHVLVLGGCGNRGSGVARDLMESPDVTHVRLGDIRPDIGRVHQSLRSNQKVSTEFVDITSDFADLVRAVRASDLVVNCVGPYVEFGDSVVRAAIEAKVNYLDICDDGAVTRQFLELDGAAKQAGICVCTGSGVTPGLTNMMAAYAAGSMTRVDEIEVFFAIALLDPVGRAGLLTALRQFTGDVWQFVDGKDVLVPAGTGVQETEFLPPFGRAEVRYARHPESVTLPRAFTGAQRVVNKATFWPPSVVPLFADLNRLGLTDPNPLPVNDIQVSPRDFTLAFLQHNPGLRSAPDLPASFACTVVVSGARGDADVTTTLRVAGWAGLLVAIPAATCARMLLKGEARTTGVVGPESAFDPVRFLDELATRGIHVSE